MQNGVFLLIIDQFHGGGIVDLGVAFNIGKLGVIRQRQQHQENHCQNGAGADEGGTAAAFAFVTVGDAAEQGQHEQGQDIIQRNNNTGSGLAQAEFAGQGHDDGHIVDLPEGTDQEKGEAYQNRALIVELHRRSSVRVFAVKRRNMFIIPDFGRMSSAYRKNTDEFW